MNDDATSLNRMHDIVMPPEIPWWPPAPGWLVVIAIIVIVTCYFIYHSWKQWRTNAYRRVALRELKSVRTPADVSELLRRTALAVTPRSVIATRIDTSWPDWLELTSPIQLSESQRHQLIFGPYDPSLSGSDINNLKSYAALWIRHHHVPSSR